LNYFSESERLFLNAIQQWRKKVVVILSKIDQLETNEQLAEIHRFVRNNFSTYLGIEPTIFPGNKDDMELISHIFNNSEC
jgi:sulfur relay (sulfurtransferase) DsrC/TusE family protein